LYFSFSDHVSKKYKFSQGTCVWLHARVNIWSLSLHQIDSRARLKWFDHKLTVPLQGSAMPAPIYGHGLDEMPVRHSVTNLNDFATIILPTQHRDELGVERLGFDYFDHDRSSFLKVY